MKFIRPLIVLLLLGFTFLANAQVISDVSIKSVLVIKFAEHTEYIDKYTFSKFVIVYVGSNKEQIASLQTLAKDRLIHERPVVFIHVANIKDRPKQANLIFLANEFNDQLEQLWIDPPPVNTLIVTEESDNISYSMINILIDKQGKPSFQVNKMAMNAMNLNPKKEIIGQGCSFVDLRKEYKKNSEQLANAMQETENQKKLVAKNKRELETIEIQLSEQNIHLKEQNSTIIVQNDKIKQQEDILNKLSSRIEKQNEEISDKYRIIADQSTQINQQKTELNDKRETLFRQGRRLAQLNGFIHEKQKIEKQQRIELQIQSDKIEQQRLIIWIVAVSIFIVFILLTLILKAFLDKRRINKELDSKQTELIEKQQEVLQQSETLQSINTDLALQKQRVEEAFSQLKETQGQLVQQEKMASLGVLTAGLAHEINNPINYINSGVGGLKNVMQQVDVLLQNAVQENPEEVAECREAFSILTTNIETGINRTSEIIRSLLTFSHADSGEKKPANINANIDATLVILNNSYKHHIKVIKNYSNLPDIYCFPGRLNQVFMNVLSNSIQAIEKSGTIYIETRMMNDTIEIEIKDTGNGINPENINRIFEPFFTTKDVGQGTGLGLSISYNIIKQHNGHIFVESKIGQGSVFTISLPALLAH